MLYPTFPRNKKSAALFLLVIVWGCSAYNVKHIHGVKRKSFMRRMGTVQEDYSDNVMNTYSRYDLTVSHGNGTYIYDTDKNEYLDFASGIATCCLGHAHPALRKAVCEQMDRVNHVSNLYFIPEQAALAKWLVKNSCADKAFFCNSGAEANEAAVKLARKYARTKLNLDFPIILTALASFHGRTVTTITATGQSKYQKDFGPLTPGFRYFRYNDIESLKAAIAGIKENEDKGYGLAAILVEPLQGEGGVVMPNIEFFKYVRKVCDETGALLIADEVQTGMGRTGKLWGYQHLGVEPDVFTSAKALGGGIPIGAMLCKNKFNVFGPGDHASTYGGNPLACAAGLAVASVFDSENIVPNSMQRGEQLRNLATEVKNRFPDLISDVRGMGLINGIELDPDCGFSSVDMSKVLLSNGLLVVPAGSYVVRFLPPLIVSASDISIAMSIFETSLVQLQQATLEKSIGVDSRKSQESSEQTSSRVKNNSIGNFFGKFFKSEAKS